MYPICACIVSIWRSGAFGANTAIPLRSYKLLAEEDNGIEFLRTLKLCLYGGSAMPTELGHRLVEAGVRLAGHYGSTETGQLMTSFRDFDEDKDWDYNRVSDVLRPYIDFEDQGNGTYEVIVKDGWRGKVSLGGVGRALLSCVTDAVALSQSMSNRPNNDYALSDLFIKHPTIDNRWKFVGRIDDTLVLINGEKVRFTEFLARITC